VRPRHLSSVTPILVLALAGLACQPAEPAHRYPIVGQVLGINTTEQTVTIQHEDIVGFMPAMTMSFPVARPELLDGREPGELITGILEVQNSLGRLVDITHVGMGEPPSPNRVALTMELLEVGDEVPDAAFIDQSDRRRSFAEWRGQDTLVTFVYTRCPLPNFCPLMDQNFATIQETLSEDPALAGKVALVSITFDPEHDTPEVLAAHATARHADPAVWTWLTGDRETIERFAGRFGVTVMREDPTIVDITHNLRTIHVGPDGRVRHVYSGNGWTPGEVVADLRSAVTAR